MISDREWRCTVAIALVFIVLAPFGALKVYEIVKYIYQHLHWVP